MDSETFRGVNSRLPELGGVVLEATQKLLRSRAMPSAQELASMFSCPPGTEIMHSRDPGVRSISPGKLAKWAEVVIEDWV